MFFFFFWGGGGESEGVGFFCSQCVPKDNHKMFPITPHLIPYPTSTLVTYRKQPKGDNYNVPIYLRTVQSLINFLVMGQ